MDAVLSPEVETSSKHFKWAVLFCLIVALLSRLCFLGDPFKNDAAIYIYFGKVVWTGGHLYQDFWDTKLPSVGLLMAPLYAAFGNHWWPYVLLQTAMGVSGAFFLAIAVKNYVGRWAYAPALLFGLVGLNLSRITITGFQLETIQMFLEILAACVVLRSLSRQGLSQVFLAGFLVVLAAMPKPTGLAVGGAAACAYAWESRTLGSRRSLLRILALGAGAAIPVLIVAVWVSMQPWRIEMPSLFREIRLYGSGVPWRRLLEVRAWVFLLLPLTPLMIRWIWDVCTSFSAPAAYTSPIVAEKPAPPVMVFAIAWCAAEIFAVIMQRRLYSYHFLVIMPAAVLLFALGRRMRLIPILVAIAPIALISVAYSIPLFKMLRDPRVMPVSQYVAAHTQPGDSVWGDPEARLILEADRLPGSRLQMSFYLVNHDDAPREFTQTILNDFETRKPKYIVLQQDWSKGVRQEAKETVWLTWLPARRKAYLQACDQIERYINAHYQLEKTLDGKSAWRRRES